MLRARQKGEGVGLEEGGGGGGGAPPKVQTSSCSCSYTIQQCQEEDWDREQAVIFDKKKTVRRKKSFNLHGFG